MDAGRGAPQVSTEQPAVEVAQPAAPISQGNKGINPERRLKRITVKGRLPIGFYFNS